jgi:hypothetical protein
LETLYKNYKDRAEFLLVYIREAHPDSVLFTVKNGKEVLEKIEQTSDLLERSLHAEQCLASLKLSLPAVVDRADNKVNMAYAGWPDRFAVVGLDGRIAFYGKQGPSGFKPSEVEEWLKNNTKPATNPAAKTDSAKTP